MSEKMIESLGYRPLLHIANSAATLKKPEYAFDLVRLGIALYGCGAEELRPVSTLKSRIVQIREVAEGESVGYGCAQILNHLSRIATVPIGYADGLDRHLGCGRWSCLVNGRLVPTVGRICMDTCMLNVTDADAAEGDEVVIFGQQSGLRADDMAKVLDTIPYEIMTSVSARVKRTFKK
jgi:alanine racemase